MTANPSQEHQRLISALKRAFINRKGFVVDYSTLTEDQQPPQVSDYIPDIYARDPATGLVIIGEAKTPEDIDSVYSRHQYLAFSTRVMSSGLQRGQTVPFHIIVPQEEKAKLKQVLASLGLSQKIGNTIIIWTI